MKTLTKAKHRSIIVWICVLICLSFSLRVYSESYTLSVGESVTIRQNAVMGGYIEYVGLADYLDPHLLFVQNNDGSATITIKSYFSNSIIVKLVFVEYYNSYYNGRNHSQAYTSYKDVTINCKYQAPESEKKPTKILLPERIKVIANGDYTFVTPTFEPSGTSTTNLSWDCGAGTGSIKIKYTADGRCAILGIAPGICYLYVTVGEDNLYDSKSDLSASAIVEVIEPNYPTPTNIYIPESVEISVGGFCNLTPILIPEGTSTSFTWTSSNPNVASVNAGKVTGLTLGTTVITLKTKNEITVNCTVTVVAKNGKDDEEEDTTPASMGIVDGHEYVDLGLSVNWAKMDLGANSENEVGDLFAWGETHAKSSYSINNYQYGSSIYSWTNIGSSIKGTKYDAAYVNWGDNWKMPSTSEISELISNCTFIKEEKNGVKTIRVTGPNGNSIVLPYNDSKCAKLNSGSKSYYYCTYWSSNIDGSVSGGSIAKALGININKDKKVIGLSGKEYRNCGFAIRAVSSKSINSDNNKPVSITLPNDTLIELYETIQLPYSITPGNSSTSIKWTTSNPSIASVSPQGVITGLKPGKVIISVFTDNGLISNCQVTIEGWKVVAAEPGYHNSFFLTDKGSLYAQGRNSLGQLGDGTYQDRNIPVQVMTDVKSVYSNEYRTFVQKTDNSLWTCGYNSTYYALVGDNIFITSGLLGQPYFIKISENVIDYSSEYSYSTTLLVKNDFTLLGSGTFNKKVNRETFLKIDDNVLTAAISRSSPFKILYIKNDGSLWEIKKDSTAKNVMYDVAYASTSGKHTLIIKKDGSLWAYGINDSGQLCDGTTTDREEPTKVMENVKNVSAGNGCSYILKEDHSLWRNMKTEDGSFRLKQIMDNVASISKCEVNGSRILIITRGGSVWDYNTELVRVFEGDIEPRDVFLPRAGYATFYDSEADYALPNDLTAQVVTNANNNKITYQALTGNVIPKGVPVMLVSNQREGTCTLTASYVTDTYNGINLLRGSDVSTTVRPSSSEYAYKLSYGPSDTKWSNVFGWYWGADNGGAFQIEGHKAWLVVPKSSGTRGFTIDGDATGIINVNDETITNTSYYDLQGRSVIQPAKGVYIKNGKKVVVK